MRERVLRPPSFELRARQFLGEGRACVCRHAARCPPCATTWRSTASTAAWLVDPNNPLVRAGPSTASGNSSSGVGWSRRARISVHRGQPHAPSCSTGLRRNSSQRDGARRPWCGPSSCRRRIASRRPCRLPSPIDPYNRLFARGPRVRLEAEMIRDVSLSVSGLLSDRMFGPSVFPMQPDGIWNMPHNSDKWTVSQGDDRFRRSLHVLAADLALSELHDVRRDEPRVLHGAAVRSRTRRSRRSRCSTIRRLRTRALAGRMIAAVHRLPPVRRRE